MCVCVCVCVCMSVWLFIAVTSHVCNIWIANDMTDSNTSLFSVSGLFLLFQNSMCVYVSVSECVCVCVAVNNR